MAATLVTSRTALSPEGTAEPGGGPSGRRGILVAAASAALLAGCGFQLRKAPDFAFDSIAIIAPDTSPLANELRRSLAANGRVRVLPAGTAPAQARVVLDVPSELREKVVVGLNASGQVREFQLRTRIHFRLRTGEGKELIPDTELLQERDISFNESAVLAKEAEEALLYRDMQTDLVQQLMRRLAAIRTL
jgi:LPS-assembly lipoprotein